MSSSRIIRQKHIKKFEADYKQLLNFFNNEANNNVLQQVKDFPLLLAPTYDLLTQREHIWNLNSQQTNKQERQQFDDLLEHRLADLNAMCDAISLIFEQPNAKTQEEVCERLLARIDFYQQRKDSLAEYETWPVNVDTLQAESARPKNDEATGIGFEIVLLGLIAGTVCAVFAFPVATAITLGVLLVAGIIGLAYAVIRESDQEKVNAKPYADQLCTMFSKTAKKIQPDTVTPGVDLEPGKTQGHSSFLLGATA